MGARLSVLIFPPIFVSVPSLLSHKVFFESIHLEETDVGRLYRVFKCIDASSKGEISVLDLQLFLDREITPFTNLILSMFDIDKSGAIDFKEFSIIVYNYCSLSRKNLVLFSFELYDEDESEGIDIKELSKMLSDVYGSKLNSNRNAQLILQSIQKLPSQSCGRISKSAFVDFCRTHAALLYPAYDLQRHMMHRIIGKGFWDMISHRRRVQFGDLSLSPKDLKAMSTADYVQLDGQKLKYVTISDRPAKRSSSLIPSSATASFKVRRSTVVTGDSSLTQSISSPGVADVSITGGVAKKPWRNSGKFPPPTMSTTNRALSSKSSSRKRMSLRDNLDDGTEEDTLRSHTRGSFLHNAHEMAASEHDSPQLEGGGRTLSRKVVSRHFSRKQKGPISADFDDISDGSSGGVVLSVAQQRVDAVRRKSTLRSSAFEEDTGGGGSGGGVGGGDFRVARERRTSRKLGTTGNASTDVRL